VFRIFGPPGTGKTTTLLNLVDKELSKGTPSSEIAFLAFTRKAASEARERACRRFGLDAKSDLPYFRTLHSLAFRLVGLTTDQLMGPEHYREIENRIGFDLAGGTTSEEDFTNAIKRESDILRLITLARLKRVALHSEYNRSSIRYSWLEVNYVAGAVAQYKKSNGLHDFTDMLELFVIKGPQICPPLRLCLLDEAQDLSPLQWEIAHLLDSKSDKMYCAGDDDQAIYDFAGADVEHFINLPGGAEILETSYRVPASVHRLATGLSSRIRRRFPKNYLPKKEEGSVQRIYSPESLDFSQGDWLVLSQANYQINPVSAILKQSGYYFERSGYPSVAPKISSALLSWKRLQNNEVIDVASAKVLYSFMRGNGVQVARGFKTIKADESAFLSLDQLQQQHGLLATADMDWQTALDRLPDIDRAYINALLRRGEDLEEMPRIKLSTIHGAKGGEATNVVVFSDLTAAADESMQISPDTLHRVFYVAVTRTKQNLFIVEPETYQRSYNL
jgi:DNA helicase-2/ATP-dependent DNA helicase PcrA|tara:strand:- start:2797 stop:4308 length:1512 start_codon:yes stop_codon:yes gene_type:complete